MGQGKSNILQGAWPVLVLGFIIVLWLILKFGMSIQIKDSSVLESIDQLERTETCIECHKEMTGFSKYHDPKNIGCVVCHLGNPTSLEKDVSHKDMIVIPGNLSNAEQTCGTCHPNELHKIQHSLMTTNSGIVAVDKYVFGETDSPDHFYDIRNLAHTEVDDHLRNLCANCHLGAEKKDLGSISELSRGGGCNACHLNYSEKAENQLTTYLNSNKDVLPKLHPSTDIFVSDEHCFGCHSRSSRISTNYMGWHETLLEEDEIVSDDSLKIFKDKRIYQYKGEDVHHSKGLLCIDCHSSHEVMGDGKDYLHEENAVSLNCADCHIKDKPQTISYGQLDQESLLVFMHRSYSHSDKEILVAKKDGHPLVNTYVDEKGDVYLIGKKDKKEHLVSKQSEDCARDASHQSLSCSSCHTQWAPRCIGCHNTYDDMKQGYDLLDKKMIKGTWVEHVYEFNSGLPTLGVRTTPNGAHIEPAVPGMILTVDHSKHPNSVSSKEEFTRLYAPNAPHTIAKESRTCISCHADPSALGYGEGKLKYVLKDSVGHWVFEPKYDLNVNDQLPEDAWIPFLEEFKREKISTRTDFRPLNIKEQEKILKVGACLQCHEGSSKIMKQSLTTGLNPLLLNVSNHCILPEY